MSTIQLIETRNVHYLDRMSRRWEYDVLRFDGCCKRQNMTHRELLKAPENRYWKVLVEGVEAGFIRLNFKSPVVAELHLCLTPDFYGRLSLEIVREFLRMAREQGIETIETYFPAWCRRTLIFGGKFGASITHRKAGIFRAGKEYDLIFITLNLKGLTWEA
jgi:hypothetical protein